MIVLACRGFWNTPVIRGCGTCQKSRLLRRSLARPGPWQILVVVLDLNAESERCFWSGNADSRDLHRICLQLCRDRCDVSVLSGQKPVHPKGFRTHAQSVSSSREHTRPHRMSFALAMILTMNERRIQRTHPSSGMGSSLNASKDIGIGVTDFALTCESEPEMDAVCAAVVGSDRTGRSSARKDLPTYATLATDDSHSLEKGDDSTLHIHHLCRIVSQTLYHELGLDSNEIEIIFEEHETLFHELGLDSNGS